MHARSEQLQCNFYVQQYFPINYGEAKYIIIIFSEKRLFIIIFYQLWKLQRRLRAIFTFKVWSSYLQT